MPHNGHLSRIKDDIHCLIVHCTYLHAQAQSSLRECQGIKELRNAGLVKDKPKDKPASKPSAQGSKNVKP